MNRASSARLLTVLLVITMLSPLVQAEIDPRLTASPTAQEADADNPAEYTITIVRAHLIRRMQLTVSLLHDTLLW